jgi:hypothetical protein
MPFLAPLLLLLLLPVLVVVVVQQHMPLVTYERYSMMCCCASATQLQTGPHPRVWHINDAQAQPMLVLLLILLL